METLLVAFASYNLFKQAWRGRQKKVLQFAQGEVEVQGVVENETTKKDIVLIEEQYVWSEDSWVELQEKQAI